MPNVPCIIDEIHSYLLRAYPGNNSVK